MLLCSHCHLIKEAKRLNSVLSTYPHFEMIDSSRDYGITVICRDIAFVANFWTSQRMAKGGL